VFLRLKTLLKGHRFQPVEFKGTKWWHCRRWLEKNCTECFQ
jgi:hypothetical protein